MADGKDIGILLKVLLDANTVDINKQIKTLSTKIDKLKIKLDIDTKEIDILANKLKGLQLGSINNPLGSPKSKPFIDADAIEIQITKINNQLDRLKVNKDKVFADTRVSNEVLKLKDLEAQFRNGAISSKEYALQMDNVRTKTAQVAGEFRNVNHDGYGFIDMISLAAKKFMIWQISVGGVMLVLRSLRDGIQNLKEIDTELVNIAKVTSYTSQEMKELAKNATEVGKGFGREATDYLKAVTEFARAGMGKQAEELGKTSLLLQNVGDVSAETANEMLLAVNAAYDLGGSQEELTKVIDKLNIVSNQNPTSVAKMADGIKVAASVFEQAGFSIDEFIALVGTATSATQRSGAEMARGLRTVLMNIRGVQDEEAETTLESISKAEGVLKSIGIEVRKSATEFREPMQVLSELAQKYEELGKAGRTVKQAEILESLAGKRQSNILASVLKQWDMVGKQIDEAANSQGSAMRENEIYMQSWEARTKQLSATMTMFWQNLISTDAVKEFISSLTRIVSVLDALVNNSFSQFIIKVALTTGAIATLGIGLNALKASYLGTTLGVIALDVAEKGLLATTKTLTATMLKSPLFWIAAGVTVIYGVINAVDALTVSVEEQRQKVEDLTKKYDDLKSKIEELKSIENPTQNQQQYIALLEKELSLQQAILKTEKERLMQKEVFGEGVLGNGIEGEVEAAKAFLDNYKDYVKNVQQQISDLQSQGLSADFYIKDLEESKNALREYELGLIENRKTLQDYMDYFGKETPDNVKQLATQIDGLIKKFDEYNPVVKESADKTKESIEQQSQAFKSIIEDAEKYKETIDDLNKEISSSINTIQSLNTAIQELSTKEGLSAKSLEDLITNYPDLIMYLDDEKRLKTELNKILENETESQKQLFKSKLELSTQYFNQMIKGNAEVWNIISKYYNTDANNFKTVADVKKKINDALVKYIGESWSDLYDNEIQAISTIEYGLRTGLNQVRDDVTRKRMLEQLADVQKQREILESINKPLELTVDKINFEKLNEPKETKSGKNTPDINEIELDRFYKLKETVDLTNDSIENYKKLISNTNDVAKRNKYENELIEIYKKQQSQLHELAETRRKAIAENVEILRNNNFEVTYDAINNDFRIANEEHINKIYGKNNEETNKIRKNLKDIIDQTKEWNKANQDNGDSWQDISAAIKDINEDKLKTVQDTEEKIADIIKESVKKEKDALDDKFNKFKDTIQKQKDLLDEQYNKEEYLRNLSKKEDKAQEIRNRMSGLQLAANTGDYQAYKELQELQKELSEQESEIKEYKNEQSYKLKKENLDKQLKAQEDFVNQRKDSLDKEYTDESIMLKAKQALINGFFVDINGDVITFQDNLTSYMEKIGISIEDNLISQLKTVRTMLQELGNALGNSSLSNMDTELRKYYESLNKTVEWKNGKVYIDGKILDVSGLQNVNGRFYGSKDMLDNKLSKLTSGNTLSSMVNSLLNNISIPLTNIKMNNLVPSTVGDIYVTVQANNIDKTNTANLGYKIGQSALEAIRKGLEKGTR